MVALSNSAGNVVESYTYDVFGEPSGTGSVGNPYFFTGRRLDTETGLYYYRFRYYKPDLGRFLQTDPLSMLLQTISTSQAARENAFSKYPYISARTAGEFLHTDAIGRFLRNELKGSLMQTAQYGFYIDLNLYTYCGNNPLVFIDPYGLGFWRTLRKAKIVIGYGMLGIGTAVVIVATSPAWVTAGGVIAVGGIGIIVWDIIDTGEELKHPPGEGAFKRHRKQLEDEMDKVPGEGKQCP